MRSLFFIAGLFGVIALAIWAYRENYATKAELDQVTSLRRDIAAQHERLSVLRAEWAYLNRPDRLRDLAEIYFDRLALLPQRPEQFGQIDQVAFPPEKLDLSNSVDVSTEATQ